MCGAWSIEYPNLHASETISLSRQHCEDLHNLKDIILDELPLTVEDRNGAPRGILISPKARGSTVYDIIVGSIDKEGSCQGGRMQYRHVDYSRERATIQLNLTFTKRLMSITDMNNKMGASCDSMK